jgi:hypothetical protein
MGTSGTFNRPPDFVIFSPLINGWLMPYLSIKEKVIRPVKVQSF